MWVGCEGVKMGGIACPWAVKRCIDPPAGSLSVSAARVARVIAKIEVVLCNVRGVELGRIWGKLASL